MRPKSLTTRFQGTANDTLELRARRCVLIKGKSRNYRIEEIRELVGGVGGEHLRRSLARLGGAGLLKFSQTAIEFTQPNADALGEELDDLAGMFELVPNHRRLVPVPRRIVRLIAGGARRVVIATILGHLLRCLYYRRGLCFPDGSCKATWIADVFGVNARNVKSARKHLVAIGWVTPVKTHQLHLNRFGQRARINLEWSRNDISGRVKRSPRTGLSTTGSPPPYKNKNLSSRIYMNQKPVNGLGSGVCKRRPKRGSPTMNHIEPNDLHDPVRLAHLHRDAIERGLISRSECDRLRFFAAAEHAKAIGTRNPCGLFATIVRRGLWAYITQDDEDVAVKILKRLTEENEISCEKADGEGIMRFVANLSCKSVTGGFLACAI